LLRIATIPFYWFRRWCRSYL